MNFNAVFKNIVEDYPLPIVVVDINHIIQYLNKMALKKYDKDGGNSLIGKSLLNCHNDFSNELILSAFEKLKSNKDLSEVLMYYNEKKKRNLYLIAIRDENKDLIGYYEMHIR